MSPLNPQELKFTESHEWVFEKDGTATMGISDYASGQMADLVFLELKKVGTVVKQFQQVGELESVKAVSTIYSPLSGEIIEVNEPLTRDPELVKKDPFGESWLLKLRPADLSELNSLMTLERYREFCASLHEEG